MLQDFISPMIDNQFKCNFIFVNMPHRIRKCINTLYDYVIIINTYVTLMYELKIIGKVFTSKSVRTGTSSYEKRIYRAAVSQELRNTALDLCTKLSCVIPSCIFFVKQRSPVRLIAYQNTCFDLWT